MQIGFTGTRQGMTDNQIASFRRLITRWQVTQFHHGDCVGADKQANDIIRERYPSYMGITVHPPLDPKHRAYCKVGWYNGDTETDWKDPGAFWLAGKLLGPLPYLDRNRAIVDATGVLIAAPSTERERQRSGTWYTIKYAIKVGKPVYIILPKGSVATSPFPLSLMDQGE